MQTNLHVAAGLSCRHSNVCTAHGKNAPDGRTASLIIVNGKANIHVRILTGTRLRHLHPICCSSVNGHLALSPPANSSQQPTTCRALVRVFRPSFLLDSRVSLAGT